MLQWFMPRGYDVVPFHLLDRGNSKHKLESIENIKQVYQTSNTPGQPRVLIVSILRK